MKTTWNDNYLYWGDEELFESLYNTDPSELILECEISRIEFDDGYTFTK